MSSKVKAEHHEDSAGMAMFRRCLVITGAIHAESCVNTCSAHECAGAHMPEPAMPSST